MEKPWVVYNHIVPIGIGLAVEEKGDKISVKYLEDQAYTPDPWPADHIERFATSKEAVDYYMHEHSGHETREDVMSTLKVAFPKTLENELKESNSTLSRAK